MLKQFQAIFYSLFLLLSGTIFSALPQADDASHALALKKISAERILEQEAHFLQIIEKAQKNRQRSFFVGGMAASFLVVYVCWVIRDYFQNNEQSSSLEGKKHNDFTPLTVAEQRLALNTYYLLRTKKSFWERLKSNVDKGVGLALSSMIIGFLLNASSLTFTNVKASLESFFGKSPQAFFKMIQRALLENAHRFYESSCGVLGDLSHLGTSQSVASVKHRDFFYADFILAYNELVGIVEAFVALVLVLEKNGSVLSTEYKETFAVGLTYLTDLVDEIGANAEKFMVQNVSAQELLLGARKFIATASRVSNSLGTIFYGKEFSEVQ
jgi:hypothetical protein